MRSIAEASVGSSSEDSDAHYVRLEDAPHSPSPAPRARAMERMQAGSSPAYTSTSDVVRDLHRTIEEKQPNFSANRLLSQSVDGLHLPQHMRLHPDIGTASELAQPGGFRRAHLEQQAAASGQEPTRRQEHYRRTPLVEHLHQEGFVRRFVPHVVQQLEDGTEVVYASRAYRRGARPHIIRTASGLPPDASQDRVRFFGFRPLSVPYWVSFSFLVGALLFVYGSSTWFLMEVGDGFGTLRNAAESPRNRLRTLRIAPDCLLVVLPRAAPPRAGAGLCDARVRALPGRLLLVPRGLLSRLRRGDRRRWLMMACDGS